MKTMSPICDEKEWTTYVGVMMKSEIHVIELIVRMVARNDVGDESSRSPTLSEAVDKQHIKCGVVLTQPSQQTQYADEPPFVASNKTMLNVQPCSAPRALATLMPFPEYTYGTSFPDGLFVKKFSRRAKIKKITHQSPLVPSC
jgi:hypothetical protein